MGDQKRGRRWFDPFKNILVETKIHIFLQNIHHENEEIGKKGISLLEATKRREKALGEPLTSSKNIGFFKNT